MKNSGFFLLFAIYFFEIFFFGPLSITSTRVAWGWVVLAFLASICGLVALLNSQIKLPPKKIGLWLMGFLALAVVFSLINGGNLLEEKWTHRWLTLILFMSLLQIFATSEDLVKAVRYPLLVFVFALCAESFYQNFFTCQTSTLGTSCFSSRFYNINMLTQALLMAVVLLDFVKTGAHKKMQWLFYTAIVLSIFIFVYSQSRSAFIAIFIFAVSRLFFSQKEFWRWFLPLLVATFIFTVVDTRQSSGSRTTVKATSTNYRKELALGSLRMIRENPLGVGVNNFEYGFGPYRNDGELPPSPNVLDKTPHDDFLLVLTEEGWVVGGLLLFICGLLAVNAFKHLRQKRRSLWSGFFIIILPELLFQFPSDMHFFGFCLALVLAIECLNGLPLVFSFKPAYRAIAAVMILFFGAAGVLRYTLWVPAQFSPQYCSVFHDNWRNCGSYTQTHINRGDGITADLTVAPVIRYQPYNFYMLQWDYNLRDPHHTGILICNYSALFKFQFSIPGSDNSPCAQNITRQEMQSRMRDYSSNR